MPKIDMAQTKRRVGSGYPSPFDKPCAIRIRETLGDAGGISQFGVNRLTLPPGAWSSQRHWHSHEDEFVFVLAGEVTLVDDSGAHVLRAGDCASFPAGDENGHHLQNRSKADAVVIEVGSRRPDVDATDYPDINMRYDPKDGYVRRDGSRYS
jgi:uncharacterized cupin superfamily protein